VSDLTGSSDDLSAQLGDAVEPDQGYEGDGVGQQEAPPVRLSAFAQSYLAQVPEQERDLVTRHVQEWDRGFNKYAERIQRQYGQYDQLGSFDEITQAVSIARMISQDPHGAAQWLIDQGYGPQQAAQAVQNAQQGQQGQPQAPQQDQLPPAVQQELQQYKMALGAMYERMNQDQLQRDTERYEKEIEAGLEAARAKYPGIPETLVLHLMKGGMEMEDAVSQVASQIQAGVNTRAAPPAPRVLSSASLPPQAAKSPSEMTDDERKASLAAALQGVVT
jgi:hypothetical protein